MTSFTGIRRQLSEQAFLPRLTLFFSLLTLGGDFIELFGVGKRGGAFFTDQDWRFAESERAGDVAEVQAFDVEDVFERRRVGGDGSDVGAEGVFGARFETWVGLHLSFRGGKQRFDRDVLGWVVSRGRILVVAAIFAHGCLRENVQNSP